MTAVWMFVGSYSPASEAGIHRLLVDPRSGALTGAGSISGVQNPSFLWVHPRGDVLYAVSETGLASDGAIGSVVAFGIDSGRPGNPFIPLGSRSTHGDNPCHIDVDPTGRWLSVANYGSGSLATFHILEDGSLGEAACVLDHEGSGPDPVRQSHPHAHCSTFAPGGRYLVAADLGADRILVHAFDPSTGRMTPHWELATAPGAGPRHVAFHQGGSDMFAVNELDNTISHFTWNGESGRLAMIRTVSTIPEGSKASLAADLRVSPHGNRVYVSNRGHDSLAAFSFDGDSGLDRQWVNRIRGSWPRSIALVPGARSIAVAYQHSDRVDLLPLAEETGTSPVPEFSVPVSRPSYVTFVVAAT